MQDAVDRTRRSLRIQILSRAKSTINFRAVKIKTEISEPALFFS